MTFFFGFKNRSRKFSQRRSKKTIQQAIENEVQELVDLYKNQKDEKGRRIIKRMVIFLPDKFKQVLGI